MNEEQAIIRIEEYSFAYEADPDHVVLKDISLQIDQAKISAILGLSGCGKTTLCLALCGIIPTMISGRHNGRIFIKGNNIEDQSLNQIARTIGYVMQNPDDQLVCTTVEDELAFAQENLAMDPTEIKKKVDWVLEILGLDSLRLRNPNQLSGGQKQMVAIGSILMLDPDILIMDEPLSSLDAEGKAVVHQLMLFLKGLGKTIILVEHDIESLQFADNWFVLSEGRLVAQGNPSDFMSDKRILIENKLI